MEQSGLYRGNHGEALRFFTRALKNNFLSEKHGRPIFDTGLFVEIITPGSSASLPEKLVERTMSEEAGVEKGQRKVTRTPDYERFKAQIESYKNQNGDHLESGMPISQWPMVDVGTAHTLKAAGVHTVEQLAQVTDGNLQNLGTGGRHLRDQAKAYITARQFGVPVAQQTAEAANLRSELERVTRERDDALSALAEANRRIEGGAGTVQPPPEAFIDLSAVSEALTADDGGGETDQEVI